jgi:aryl-alcohol dehydrogenase-like predicted oxidoreductase
MGMSGMYGPSSDAESIATIHAALDAGVNVLDTGDFYGMGHNEMLLGRALAGRHRDGVLLSVKFGALRAPDGSWIGLDLRPASIRNFLAYTLKRLGVEAIDIYRPARMIANGEVPVEDTIGAIKDLITAGYVRHLGLSEVGPDVIRRAHAVHPVADLQIEYSLVSRGLEPRILPLLRELGIGLTAYGVLSRGLLSGSKPVGPSDFRAHLPRFSGENLTHNEKLLAVLREIAQASSATPSKVAIAWVLSRGNDIVPVIGARTRTQLSESLGATTLILSPAQLAQLEANLPPVAGDRYDPHQMAMLDSERGR